MTNDILQASSIKDYMITNKYGGDHGLVICFGDPSMFAVYALAKNKLHKVCGNLVLLDVGKSNISKPNTIESIIRSFVENKHNDTLPSLYVFEAMIQHENNSSTVETTVQNKRKRSVSQHATESSFVFTDALVYDNTLVESRPLIERRNLLSSFINTFNLLNIDSSLSFDVSQVVKACTWSDVLEKRNKSFIAKPLIGSLLESKSYKITFHEQITINFKVQHVPLKRLFYLYVIGSPSQVISAKTLNNKYSVDHFGYSLISGNVSTNADKYLLYVSPYIKESYV